jgi:hypothetical protein
LRALAGVGPVRRRPAGWRVGGLAGWRPSSSPAGPRTASYGSVRCRPSHSGSAAARPRYARTGGRGCSATGAPSRASRPRCATPAPCPRSSATRSQVPSREGSASARPPCAPRSAPVRPRRDPRTGYRVHGPADARDALLVHQLGRGGCPLGQVAPLIAQVRTAGGVAPLESTLRDWHARLPARSRAMLAGAAALDAYLSGPPATAWRGAPIGAASNFATCTRSSSRPMGSTSVDGTVQAYAPATAP